MKIVNAPAFQHEQIADERIDSSGIPTPDTFADHQVPLVVAHEGSDESPLSHISHIHGRSYLLEDAPPDGQSWVDQYDNPYNAITTKGNNLTRHLLIRSGTAPSGYLPYGLQEGDALRRVARASRIMRQAGIDTERPIGIYQPQQLAYEGTLVDVPDYKQLVMESMVKRIKSGDDTQNFSLEEVGSAAKAVDQMDFFVTLRAMSTAARIGDLVVTRAEARSHDIPPGLNYSSLAQVFRDYNSYATARITVLRDLGLAPNLPTDINADTDHDVLEHYFAEALPKLMARNMGLLHSLGLMHHFPHANNFTGLGGIVDLDSVQGGKLRLRDRRMRDLPERQVEEKTSVSLDALAEFRLYQGHGLDWQAISQHARENFTQVYMDTYDGSMSPNDRMKMVFLDAAYYPAGNFAEGSPLEIGSLERFYPGATTALDEVEAVVMAALTDDFKLCSVDYAWIVLDHTRDPFQIWGMDEVFKESRDANDTLLLNLGMPPTDEELLRLLPEYYEADEAAGELYSEAARMVSLLPLMKLRILSDLKRNSTVDIIQTFIERLPGSGEIDPEEVSQYLKPVEHEILKRVEARTEKPDPAEFWSIARTIFKERVLDTFDKSIVPANEFIQTSDIDLEHYVAFWDFHYANKDPLIEHACSGLSDEQIATMITKHAPKPQLAGSAEEVLQIEPGEGEEVRLVITDGDINNVVHHEDYGGKYEDINYRQYQKSDGSVPSNATVALYLLQSNGGKFRLIHKKLQRTK
jgi:hypothetical protein